QRRRRFRLHLAGRQRVDYHQLALLRLLRQRRTQRAAFDFLRQREVVAARLRSEDGAALAPQRVSDFADARAAGALLPPRLLARAADVRAVLRLVRAATFRGVRVHHRLPHHVGIHASAKHRVGQIDRADLFVLVVHDIELHGYFLPFFGFSTWATLILCGAIALRMIT